MRDPPSEGKRRPADGEEKGTVPFPTKLGRNKTTFHTGNALQYQSRLRGTVPFSGPVSGDGTSGDLGYPSTVELDDGSLLSVWYEQMKGSARAVLRQARWTIEA